MSALHILTQRRWLRQGNLASLRRICLLVALSLSLGCEPPPPPDTFVGQGRVEQVVAHDRRVVIRHSAIPKFFPAKTSSFALRSPALLDQLRPGEQVRFTLERTDQTLYLVRVEEIHGAAPAGSSAHTTVNGK